MVESRYERFKPAVVLAVFNHLRSAYSNLEVEQWCAKKRKDDGFSQSYLDDMLVFNILDDVFILEKTMGEKEREILWHPIEEATLHVFRPQAEVFSEEEKDSIESVIQDLLSSRIEREAKRVRQLTGSLKKASFPI